MSTQRVDSNPALSAEQPQGCDPTMMSIGDLEARLAEVRRRLLIAGEALRERAGPERLESYRAAPADVLGAERELGKARGQERAVPRAGFPRWDGGARCSRHLLSFHDETLECVADGLVAETKRTTLARACREALEGVMGSRSSPARAVPRIAES